MTRAQALRRASGLVFKVQFGVATPEESSELEALKAQHGITDEEAASVTATRADSAAASRAEDLEYSGRVIPTLRENTEKHGLELKFPSRPSQEVTEQLRKTKVWRWHKKKAIWYTRATDEARAFAQDLIRGVT